jgi:hypothetical protein
MESWKNRWDCCIHAQEDYFEGDSGNYELSNFFMGKFPELLGSHTYVMTYELTVMKISFKIIKVDICEMRSTFPNANAREL